VKRADRHEDTDTNTEAQFRVSSDVGDQDRLRVETSLSERDGEGVRPERPEQTGPPTSLRIFGGMVEQEAEAKTRAAVRVRRSRPSGVKQAGGVRRGSEDERPLRPATGSLQHLGDLAIQELYLERLALENFRNLVAGPVSFAPHLNVISGDNGQGKTSLIEAIYVLCTTRSFRTEKAAELIQSGTLHLRLKGSFLRSGIESIQEASLSARGRSFRIDGKARESRISYARDKPVVAFHPGDLNLAAGPSSVRRRLLDRAIVYLDPGGADARLRYQEAMRARQDLLAKGARAAELFVYEQIAAREGAVLTRSRQNAAARLHEHFGRAFEQVGVRALGVTMTFHAGGTEDPAEFARELEARRGADARRKAATFGPSRDDLLLGLEGREARSFASQGQQRLLALCLKFAELGLIREVTQTEPLLLLDDVSSELDAERTEAIFHFLKLTRSQVFVTTTRPELFTSAYSSSLPSTHADFTVLAGKIQRAQTS
jgi:DNA replication and repair protein RecF